MTVEQWPRWTLELHNPYVVVTVTIHTDDPEQIADVERAAKANGLKLVPIDRTREATW